MACNRSGKCDKKNEHAGDCNEMKNEHAGDCNEIKNEHAGDCNEMKKAPNKFWLTSPSYKKQKLIATANNLVREDIFR